MTITQRIKSELWEAMQNERSARINWKKEHPYGGDFTGEYVTSRLAEDAIRLYETRQALWTLVQFVELGLSETESDAIIERYENAANEEDAAKAEKEFYSKISIRK